MTRGDVEDPHACARCRCGESADVLSRIERAAPAVDEQSVIRVAADLGVLIRGSDERYGMIERAREQRLLRFEIVEVLRPRRALNVPGTRVAALNGFFGDQRFETLDGRGRRVEQPARARFAESFHERRRLQLQTGEHLPPLRELAPQPVLSRSSRTTLAPARAR